MGRSRRMWVSVLSCSSRTSITGWLVSLLLFTASCSSVDLQPFPARERPAEPVATVAPAPAEPARAAPWMSPQGIPISLEPRAYAETSLEGRPLWYWVTGGGPETVHILGAVHGNEQSSSELAFRFLAWSLENPEAVRGKQLVFAPLVNPDGYAAGTRENAAGVDLNRNYPARNWKPTSLRLSHHRPGIHPLSEPETRFTMFLLGLYPPTRVISLHGAAACVNYDGPAAELAEVMSRECRLPVRSSIGYPTPGSFGSLLGNDRNVPIITMELSDNASVSPSLDACQQALLAAVHFPSVAPVVAAE